MHPSIGAASRQLACIHGGTLNTLDNFGHIWTTPSAMCMLLLLLPCCDASGFMVSRMLGVAPTIADSIVDQLSRPTDKASSASGVCANCGGQEIQAVAYVFACVRVCQADATLQTARPGCCSCCVTSALLLAKRFVLPRHEMLQCQTAKKLLCSCRQLLNTLQLPSASKRSADVYMSFVPCCPPPLPHPQPYKHTRSHLLLLNRSVK